MAKKMVTSEQEPIGPDAVRDMMLAAQKHIQAPQQELNFNASSVAQRDRPVHVTIDKEGRIIDTRTGEVLQLETRAPILKANIRAQKHEVLKQEFTKAPKKVVIEHPGLDDTAPHFDARIGNHPAARNHRQLTFNVKGKYEEIANRLRRKAKLEKLKPEISRIAKKRGIAVANKVTIIQPKKFFSELELLDIEWWDYVILQQNSYAMITLDVQIDPMLTDITQLIEHPIQMKPPFQPNKPVVLPVILTKEEQRKIRRQKRAEVLKEQQEKIRFGLLAAPEPKVKISNMMRVLCSDAVPDPSKIEKYVREQMGKRIKTHEDTNAARKLSAEQRREKKTKRANEDTTNGIHVAVYRVRHLNDAAKRFKIETNCKQLHMTGCVVLCKDTNIIAVEGGPKQQKKFRRLTLHRIKWNTTSKGQVEADEGDESNVERNKCVLLWEGTVKERSFGDIKFKSCPTENFAREHFRRHGVEHYWDIGIH